MATTSRPATTHDEPRPMISRAAMTHDEPHSQNEPPRSSLVAILGREEEGLCEGRSPRTRFNAHGRRVSRDQCPTRRDHPRSNAHGHRATRTPRDAHAATVPHARMAAERRYSNAGPPRTPRDAYMATALSTSTVLSATRMAHFGANAARRAHGRHPKRRVCHRGKRTVAERRDANAAAALNAARGAPVAAPNAATCHASRARGRCAVITPPAILASPARSPQGARP